MKEGFLDYRVFHSTEEARMWADQHYGHLMHDDSFKTARDILYRYTGNMYKIINNELRFNRFRNGFNIEDAKFEDVEDKEQAISIQNALNQFSLPENIIVYRYTTVGLVKHFCNGKIRKGSVIRDPAFLSTTLVKECMKVFVKEYECTCLLKIFLPKGNKGAYVSEYRPDDKLDENEFLLPAGTNLRILKIHRFHWPYLIECVPVYEEEKSNA